MGWRIIHMRLWQVESRFEGGTGRVGEVWEWLGWWLDREGVGVLGGSRRDLEEQKTVVQIAQ